MKTQVSAESFHKMAKNDRVVVHCVRSIVGGIFRHIVDLIQHQHAAGYQVGLICDSLTIGDFENKQLNALRPYLSLGVVQLPMSRSVSLTDFGVMIRVRDLLSVVDVDVLHCHGAKGGVYGRFAAHLLSKSRIAEGRAPIVTIYSPHGGSLHYNPRSLQGQLYFAVERFMERYTSEFVFVAGFEVEAYRKKIGELKKPFSIAYNGLSESEFEPVKTVKNPVDFVYAGHMRDLKGVDLFINAVEIASARLGKPIKAQLIGEGEDKEKYRRYVEERRLGGQISFHASMPIRDVFARGQTMVVPSRAEAMPYIVLEAIGAEVPLLVSNVGGIPEIYGSYSDKLLPPGDANIIATAMIERLQNPKRARSLAQHLRRQIMKTFTVESMFQKVDAVYERHMREAYLGHVAENQGAMIPETVR